MLRAISHPRLIENPVTGINPILLVLSTIICIDPVHRPKHRLRSLANRERQGRHNGAITTTGVYRIQMT
jgi:hypothetical protein